MKRYRFAADAARDLHAIVLRIAEFNRSAARQYHESLHKAFRTIAGSPDMGERRDDLIENLRVFSHRQHVICFRPMERGIEIVRVLTGRCNGKISFVSHIRSVAEFTGVEGISIDRSSIFQAKLEGSEASSPHPGHQLGLRNRPDFAQCRACFGHVASCRENPVCRARMPLRATFLTSNEFVGSSS